MSKARVSAEQVTEIIDTNIADDVILASMIDTANLYVDTNLLDAGLTEPVLSKIELYLAAHFVAITEERGALSLSKLGDATDEWDTSNLGAGFNATRYGQTALTLDTSGTLANVGSAGFKAEFRVV